MKSVVLAAVASLIAVTATAADAQTWIPTTVTANGSFNGSLSSINDGVYPPNTTWYTTNSVYDFASTTAFTFAFGSAVNVGAFNLTVDNNDDYIVDFFNGANLVASRTVGAAQGVVTPTAGGFETFSSSRALNGTYLTNLAFINPVLASSARVRGSGGDGVYAIGEARFATAPVPEPATWAMMLLGFGGVGFMVRRRPSANARLRLI